MSRPDRVSFEGPATTSTTATRGAPVPVVSMDDLRGRGRNERVRAREALTVAGVERYGLQVKALAREVEKSPDPLARAIVRATSRRVTAPTLRSELDRLDEAFATAGRRAESNDGGTT